MRILTPRALRRGLEWFTLISVLGLGALVWYSGDVGAFVSALLNVHWGWIAVALALASLDWVGTGLRLWLAARHVHPATPVGGSIVAGGLGAWGACLTPSQTGTAPLLIWTLKRYGVPYPEATIATFITFVATVAFFGVAGPLAIALGAGRSLEQHGIPLVGVSFYDLLRASMGMFLLVGTVMLVIMVFPNAVRRFLHLVAIRVQRRRPHLGNRIERIRAGLDQSHDALVKFFRGKGWLALIGTVFLSAAAYGNKLLAGFVVLRALGIHADFTDVLLLQTLINFLLYFAPTPGGAGAAEILSAALMSIYVPNPLLASYTILWRLATSYLTVAAGSAVFWHWIRAHLTEAERAELLHV